MRLSNLQSIFLLLLAMFLVVGTLAEVPALAKPQGSPMDATELQGPPKLFRPKKGMHKEEHEVDPGNQRERADNAILENAEDNQPEGERLAGNLEDMRFIFC